MFRIDPSNAMPLYAQLEQAIRLAIATQRLSSGDQLPTVRQLAVELRINANTVAKVYAELEREGILETRRGVGTFVRAGEAKAMSKRDRKRELRALVERFLIEVEGLGFALDDVIAELQNK